MRFAIQQKFQLSLQQTAEVGKVLCEALKTFPSLPEEDDDDENPQSKRPRLTKILDEEVNVGILSTSMLEAMLIHRNLARFPIPMNL